MSSSRALKTVLTSKSRLGQAIAFNISPHGYHAHLLTRREINVRLCESFALSQLSVFFHQRQSQRIAVISMEKASLVY
jgi:hypothetical protein